MNVRKYRSSDCVELAELFYNTIHTVNAKDYTTEQLAVWATGKLDLEKCNQSFLENYSVVALDNKRIIGFGDIDRTGYLDRLFVHKDYQGRRVATALCDCLEKTVQNKVITHASITTIPFFEKRGYEVMKEQEVEKQGVVLKNFGNALTLPLCLNNLRDILFN
ncbi:GNAT family N-acetyltransferase [Bavariicoccus seileri]|uniref:GNAT family N-acetyltransferase n=1 Tax=Bavariicoccus seileri TaxID=549685 RepID=UPI00068D9E75|nr:GNAT family N-acetyltransferase [Bavariicoccus seileri]